MIKVIKYGKKRRMTCGNCDALLEFEQDDISTVKTGMNEFEQKKRLTDILKRNQHIIREKK